MTTREGGREFEFYLYSGSDHSESRVKCTTSCVDSSAPIHYVKSSEIHENTGVEENLSMEESDSEAKRDETETEPGMFVPILQELTRTVEAVKEHKVQEDQNVASMDTESMFKIFIV